MRTKPHLIWSPALAAKLRRPMMDGLKKAVELAGGQSALARAIGVKQQNVWYWLNSGAKVPAERCAAVESATNGAVTRYDLRPDIFGHAPGGAAPAPANQEAV